MCAVWGLGPTGSPGDETRGLVANVTAPRQPHAYPSGGWDQPHTQVPWGPGRTLLSFARSFLAPHRRFLSVAKGVVDIFGFCFVLFCVFTSPFFSSSCSSPSPSSKYIFVFSRAFLDSPFLFFLLLNKERAFKSTSALDHFLCFVWTPQL